MNSSLRIVFQRSQYIKWITVGLLQMKYKLIPPILGTDDRVEQTVRITDQGKIESDNSWSIEKEIHSTI